MSWSKSHGLNILERDRKSTPVSVAESSGRFGVILPLLLFVEVDVPADTVGTAVFGVLGVLVLLSLPVELDELAEAESTDAVCFSNELTNSSVDIEDARPFNDVHLSVSKLSILNFTFTLPLTEEGTLKQIYETNKTISK